MVTNFNLTLAMEQALGVAPPDDQEKNWFKADKLRLIHHVSYVERFYQAKRTELVTLECQLRTLPKFCYGTDKEQLCLARKRVRIGQKMVRLELDLVEIHRELVESTDLLLVL